MKHSNASISSIEIDRNLPGGKSDRPLCAGILFNLSSRFVSVMSGQASRHTLKIRLACYNAAGRHQHRDRPWRDVRAAYSAPPQPKREESLHRGCRRAQWRTWRCHNQRGLADSPRISIELGRSFVPLYSSTWKSRHGPLCQGFFARLCLLRGGSPEIERAPTEGSITASPLA
jgi:hypothetical protein